MMTTPRIDRALTKAFHHHADWCRTGRSAASAKSLMAAITGAPVRTVIPLEERIESALMSLAVMAPNSADAFRLEYGAGWQLVFKRHGKSINRFMWLEATEEQKAAVIGLSSAGYKSLVTLARNYIYEALTK